MLKLFGVSPMGAADVWSREAQMAVNDFLDKCDVSQPCLIW